MSRHSFVQISKLPDVWGRVDYISNPKRQEHLYATYSTTEPDFWKHLADQAQFDFRKSNQKTGRCIEARELIIALPESLQQINPKFLLKVFTEKFREKYEVQCTSALHHNKAMTNYHIHLVFADREALEQPEIKYATRNMFYDENGRHVRTKKEIQNADKTIRPGCKIISKGEAYEVRYFSERQDRFKEKSFLQEVKNMYTDLINECVSDEKDKLQVFDKTGPYLPTKKIGKNNPKAKEIEADNALRKEWNNTVDQVLIAGGTPEEVVEFKKVYVTEKVAESIRRDGNQPGIFATILRSAIEVLNSFYRFLMFRIEKAEKEAVETTVHDQTLESKTAETFDPAELQRAKADFLRLKILHDDLSAMNRKIYAIEKSIKNMNRQLKRLENGFADKVLHMFERKELRKNISSQEEKLEHVREQLRLYPTQHGFCSVGEIEIVYLRTNKTYEEILDRQKKYVDEHSDKSKDHAKKTYALEKKGGHMEKPKTERQSVLMKLAKKQVLVNENDVHKRDKTLYSNLRRDSLEI